MLHFVRKRWVCLSVNRIRSKIQASIHSVKLLIGESFIYASKSQRRFIHFFRLSHKNKCQDGPYPVEMILRETTDRFLSNPFLLHHLRVALIAKLGICLDPAAFKDPRKCHHVVVYMNFHPISPSHEEGLLLGKIDHKGKDEIPGILRLEIRDDPMEAIHVDMSGKGGLTRQRESDTLTVRLWRQARKHANSIGHTQPKVASNEEVAHNKALSEGFDPRFCDEIRRLRTLGVAVMTSHK